MNGKEVQTSLPTTTGRGQHRREWRVNKGPLKTLRGNNITIIEKMREDYCKKETSHLLHSHIPHTCELVYASVHTSRGASTGSDAHHGDRHRQTTKNKKRERRVRDGGEQREHGRERGRKKNKKSSGECGRGGDLFGVRLHTVRTTKKERKIETRAHTNPHISSRHAHLRAHKEQQQQQRTSRVKDEMTPLTGSPEPCRENVKDEHHARFTHTSCRPACVSGRTATHRDSENEGSCC